MSLTPNMARVFVASTWYETKGYSANYKLMAKCRELISGDRAEYLVETADFKPHERLMERNLLNK